MISKRSSEQSEYTGDVIDSVDIPVYGEWVWGDPYCHTLMRYVTHCRIFNVKPPPPLTDTLFVVKPDLFSDCVTCYSDGKHLVELHGKSEIEIQYGFHPTLWQRIKHLFGRWPTEHDKQVAKQKIIERLEHDRRKAHID